MNWTQEAASDTERSSPKQEFGSQTGTVRMVGYSPTAGFVITVIALDIDGELWGVTAWKTTGAERRKYWEARDD